MKLIKVLNVAEKEIESIEKQLVVTKESFPLDTPMRAMLDESLTKLLLAKKMNRVDQQKPQDNYRYIIEVPIAMKGETDYKYAGYSEPPIMAPASARQGYEDNNRFGMYPEDKRVR